MNKRDQYELLWWREIFAARFAEGELPKVGEPLFGYRLAVWVDDDEGVVPWSQRDVAEPPS